MSWEGGSEPPDQQVDYVIWKKYNECAVGFLVNTSVLTLNHHGKLVTIN